MTASIDKTACVIGVKNTEDHVPQVDYLVRLRGHKKAVISLDMDNTRIVTGSADKRMKVWKVTKAKGEEWDGEMLGTLEGHGKRVK